MAEEKMSTPEHLKEVEEGPYYKANSPARNLVSRKDTPGEKLILTGRVLDVTGKPLPEAWLDFWQADGNGMYDNAEYNLRGHQYTDENGNFRLETVIPGPYGNRAPHIHVKVKAPDSRIYTTQLFFKNHPDNSSDPLFEPATVMEVSDTPEGKRARFDIVIRVS